MKRTETLLQETDARQHERNYAGTDKHGETHSAKSGVRHGIHSGIKQRICKNQSEELKGAHIFPERGGFQIPPYLRPEISVHPDPQFQNSRKQNARRIRKRTDNAVHRSRLHEIRRSSRQILLNRAERKTDERGNFPVSATAPRGVVLSESEKHKRGKQQKDSGYAECIQTHMEKDDASEERENQCGLNNRPDDSVRSALHRIRHDLKHHIIDCPRHGIRSAGQKKHFRGTARNQIRTEHDGYAHNGCNQRTEQLNKPGVDAFFRSVSHDKPSQTPAGTDDNQSGNSESGCLKKRNGSD